MSNVTTAVPRSAMPSPDVFDLPKLLAPIPGDAPAGSDLRAGAGVGSLYYQVKDARNAARAAERQIESGAEAPPTPEWKPVVAAGTKALAEASKDLEVSAYLIEAAARLHGFAGMRDGFKMVRGLVETFWDGLFPTPDEEGLLTKVAPLTGLNGDDAEGTLLAPIRNVPLTDSASHGRLTYANYLQATATGKIADEKAKQKKIDGGAMTFDTVRAAIEETPTPWLKALDDDLTACRDEFDKLTAALDAKCGAASPPSTAIRTALMTVQDALRDVARDKLAVAQSTAPAEEPAADAGGKPAAKGKDEGGGEKLPAIRNREDALNVILILADYFRRIEPHSMVPHALEQAVRWGRMPLTDLLAELIPDDDSRTSLFRQVGIRNAAAGGDAPDEKKKKR